MNNPWLHLPATPPYVAPQDREVLARRASLLREDYELCLDLPPQPWTGNPQTANVFMLALNPGLGPFDHHQFQRADYADQWRAALTFKTRTPFYFLDPAFDGFGGGLWWRPRLKELIAAVGLTTVARSVMCVEFFPYKSKGYASLGEMLPTQLFSFELIRRAMAARKEIVIMRSERVWLQAIPELGVYPCIRLSNNRNPHLSRAQMSPEQFARLINALNG